MKLRQYMGEICTIVYVKLEGFNVSGYSKGIGYVYGRRKGHSHVISIRTSPHVHPYVYVLHSELLKVPNQLHWIC